MRLLVVILLTEILVICSLNADDQVNPETRNIGSGQVKGVIWKGWGSKIRNFFYGHYGGGKDNNYGGTNIQDVYVLNLNFSLGRRGH